MSSVTMNIRPNCGDNDTDCLILDNATALDFIFTSGGLATPGVVGLELVTDADGDLDFLDGSLGTIKDFSFAGAGTASLPIPTILAWETIGDLTIDMLSVAVVVQDNGYTCPNRNRPVPPPRFDDTTGTWNLSANQSRNDILRLCLERRGSTIPDGGSTAAAARLGPRCLRDFAPEIHLIRTVVSFKKERARGMLPRALLSFPTRSITPWRFRASPSIHRAWAG